MRIKPFIVPMIVILSTIVIYSCRLPISINKILDSEPPTTKPAQENTQPSEPQPPQPVEQPQVQEAQPAIVPDVNYEGVSFAYDHSLAAGVDISQVASQVYPDAPDWSNETAHLEFEFKGYPLQETFHKPALYIYSASDLQNTQTGTDTLEKLAFFLQKRPVTLAEDDSIPLLPFFNAAQFMQARIAYPDFQNGTGVRFVSQYGQGAWPINNHDMFYTYQGLTRDQQYYISAIFPVGHPTLPPTGDNIPWDDWGAFSDNFRTYIMEAETALDRQPDQSFTPSLVSLDEIIHSLQVH